MNTELIAFFSASGIFRKRTAEAQRKAFDETADDFRAEFDRDLSDDDWTLCVNYMREKADAKRKREAAKIERENAKAAKLEAMPVSGGADSATDHIERRKPGRYVLTVAQNNTDADSDFLASLIAYCERNGAELLIAETLYNRKAFRQPGLDETDDGTWFDPKVKPYLVSGHIDLGGTHFIADANVIVTAKHPTSGFDGASPAGVNVIIPASKIELRVGAALKGATTKIIAATGAVTKRNYILRKTGAIASFGHNIGALFVDTVAGDMRHIEQMDGASGFYDVDGYYSPDGFTPLQRGDVAALQFGDIHAEKMDAANMANCVALIERFQPENVIAHDVLDFSSRNHHNIKDPVFVHIQTVNGNTVRGDLESVAYVLDELASVAYDFGGSVHIVESNHDLAINTWLKNADFKIDPINATVYLECMLALYKHNEETGGASFNMLQYAYEKIGGGTESANISFHETDESLVIAGVEMGNHGHNGANGSRGSPKQFANLGVPMNTGHTHSPSIYGTCYTAGVSASLEMGYNVGPSSWAIAHVLTFENGQRQIIFS